MRTPPPIRMGPPRLGPLGVGPLPEQVYRYLVDEARSRSIAEVAAALGLSHRAAGDALRQLEQRSLVARSTSDPGAYAARPPELALETLVAQRGEELAQVRLYANELQGAFSRAASVGVAADLLEVVVGRDEVVRHYLHLVAGARSEFDTLTKPPYVAGDDPTEALTAEAAAIARGVRVRSVYESGALNETSTLVVARRSIELGEQARATTDLPMKLALFDRRVGLLPMRLDDPDVGALVVHPSPLLDALGALFDRVWDRAAPLLSGPGGPASAELDTRVRQVLLLMSAGLKDDSIARAMGLSRRTVQKCVTTAMTALGARTRFQAALLAFERGWVGGEPGPP